MNSKVKIKLLSLLVVTVVLLLLLNWLWWSRPVPVRVRPANVSSNSMALGWYSRFVSQTCVLAVPSWNLKEWLWQCEQDLPRRTHLVTINNAEPETLYRLVIVDGLRITWQNILPVKTKTVSTEAPPLPQPAYGTVITTNEDLASGALVYLYPISDQFNYPLAAIANVGGHYSLDLSNLVVSADRWWLDAVASGGVWADMPVSRQAINPLPTIKVRL